MINVSIQQGDNETTQDFLIRVAVVYLEEVDHTGHLLSHYPETINLDNTVDADSNEIAKELRQAFSHLDFNNYQSG